MEDPTAVSAQFYIFVTLFMLRLVTEPFIQPGNRSGYTERKGKLSLLILSAGQLLSGAAVILLLYRAKKTEDVLFAFGTIFFLAGYLGRICALKRLAGSYSQFIDCVSNGVLVTSGPYKHIRHPLYLFYIVELIGIWMIFPNMVSLAALGAVVGAVLYRVQKEDRELTGRFGNEYLIYKSRTKRLIPYIF